MPLGETVISFNMIEGDMEDVQVRLDDQHTEPLSRCWNRTQHELKKSYSKLRQYDGQYLAYSLLDQSVDIIGPIIKSMRRAIRAEHKHLEATHFRDLKYIHRLRDDLKIMCNKLKPFVRLLVHCIEDDTINPGPTIFLRDVLDNLENYFEVRHPSTLC